MRTLLYRLFIHHWPRKLISLCLSIIIWLMVNRSITVNRVIGNVPVRVINIQEGQTVDGIQLDGRLNKKITLTINGLKSVLDEISSKDFEVWIDAKNQPGEWIASIGKKNLVSLNPDCDVNKHISKVTQSELIIRQSKLMTERIPVTVTQPIGEVPKGYQLLDVYPYQLFLTVHGSEEDVKKLKSRGLTLTFNLNDIPREELDHIQSHFFSDKDDEISYFIPDSWKKISLPTLSETPVHIDDPQAKNLRIDFSRQDLIPIDFTIPVTLFFPPQYSKTLNPDTYTLTTNELIVKKNGLKVFDVPLYAQGVSRHFLDTVKDMIQVVIIASPKSESSHLLWSPQFLYPHELEDRYVAKVLSEMGENASDLHKEDYLRNRFRNYMFRFRLYTADHQKLSLKIELQRNGISVTPQTRQ